MVTRFSFVFHLTIARLKAKILLFIALLVDSLLNSIYPNLVPL